MTWWRWLLVDRLFRPAAFADWAKKAIQANDRSVVFMAGAVGFVVAIVGALYTDNLLYSALAAMVFGPLFGWSIVYCLAAAWHWILRGYGIKGSPDHSMAATAYGMAPMAWLVLLVGAVSLTSGWGLYQRFPDDLLWGVVGLTVAWVCWLLVSVMSQVHDVPVWLAAATLLTTGLLGALIVGVPFYGAAVAGWYWPPAM